MKERGGYGAEVVPQDAEKLSGGEKKSLRRLVRERNFIPRLESARPSIEGPERERLDRVIEKARFLQAGYGPKGYSYERMLSLLAYIEHNVARWERTQLFGPTHPVWEQFGTSDDEELWAPGPLTVERVQVRMDALTRQYIAHAGDPGMQERLVAPLRKAFDDLYRTMVAEQGITMDKKTFADRYVEGLAGITFAEEDEQNLRASERKGRRIGAIPALAGVLTALTLILVAASGKLEVPGNASAAISRTNEDGSSSFGPPGMSQQTVAELEEALASDTRRWEPLTPMEMENETYDGGVEPPDAPKRSDGFADAATAGH